MSALAVQHNQQHARAVILQLAVHKVADLQHDTCKVNGCTNLPENNRMRAIVRELTNRENAITKYRSTIHSQDVWPSVT